MPIYNKKPYEFNLKNVVYTMQNITFVLYQRQMILSTGPIYRE